MGVQLLRNALPEGDSVRQTLGIIERNAQLEARLVGDLLDLSRVASGKLNLQRAPVALDAVVQAAVDGRLAEAEAAGLALRADVAAGLWVLADGDRLQQVLANLLSNAVKFTPSGGAIRVGVRESAGWAQITVEDTGDGIDPGLLDHLFELFRQGEVSGQRRSGLGIGLALVKSVIDLHGGRVRAESAGPGEGSRFTVELPLIAGPEAVSRPGGMAAPARILLVEDNPDTRAMLSQSLAALGHQVQTAASGEEALQILAEREAAGAARPPTLPLAPSSTRRAGTPGILLVDIGLPGMNGYEFLERARTLPGVGHVPAFAVTALRRQDDVRQAREAGYAGHFVKPVDVAALDRHIREWLAAVVSDQ